MRAPKQTNYEIIPAYLDAVMRKDASVIDRFFAPEVEYMVNGSGAPDKAGVPPPISADCHAALPWLGLYRGREAVKELLTHIHRNLEVTAFGPRGLSLKGITDRRSAGSGCIRYLPGEPWIFLIRSGLSYGTD